MKNLVLKYGLLVIALISCLQTHSQDLKEDLKEMGERYQHSEKLIADMAIEVQFEEGGALRPYKKARIRKNGSQFYYSIDQMETIITENRLIMVNGRLKEMLYRDLQEKEKEILTKSYYQAGMDSIITQYDSVAYLGAGEKGKYYQIYSSRRMIAMTSLFINEKNGLINKIVYEYNKKLSKDVIKVAVTFKYGQDSELEGNLFKEETYLVKSGTQYKPASKYLNYELTKVDHE